VFDVFVSSLFQEITNNALIENNFFDDSVGGGQSVAVAATNTTVRYNSILGSLSFDPSSRNIDVIGNVLVGGGCQSNVNYEYNVSANFKCSPTDLRASPGFVRPVEGDMDLHLGPGSPAVGRGKPGGFPSYDIDGQSRPLGGAPDAGADER
jgi:hypothetical protein